MFSADQYELLDFGDGRRLERFGAIVLDRPCPTAEPLAKADPAAWSRTDARFDRIDAERGTWTLRGELPPRWTIRHDRLVLEMKRTDFGHVGLFAEQAENWDWLIAGNGSIFRPIDVTDGHDVVRKHGPAPLPPPRPRVLNLFAYTGGSTLAAAAAGAEVTHVDAARNIVAWARRNAELSGMADSPIRWIAEDAMKFVKRELRRGNRYDAVVLDPPSYGHGTHGEVWRLSKHLPHLLRLCAELTESGPQFMLLTCHTPGFGPGRLAEMVTESLGPGGVTAREMTLRTAAGRELPSGCMVRWEPNTMDMGK
jgi:23S rRNA (cytosine1962-C5)-methyltransferase